MEYSKRMQSQRWSQFEQTQPTKRYDSLQSHNHLNTEHLNNISTSRRLENTSCAFHLDQIITNFCKNKECLLPLCPKCVGIHCQQHAKMGIFGNFVTIDDSINEASQNLKVIFEKAQFFEKNIEKAKLTIQQKNRKLNKKLIEVKHNFIQKITVLLSNFQQSIKNIWQNEQINFIEELKQNEQISNMLYQTHNSCLKKLINPSQRLEGIIQYFHQEQNFSNIDKLSLRIQEIIERPLITFRYNYNQEKKLQSALKEIISIENYYQEIWSEFKILNTHPENKYITDYPLLKRQKQEKNYLNLQNFVTPLQDFSLEGLRKQRNDKKI